MYRVPAAAARKLRWGIFSLTAAFALVAVSTDDADARSRRSKRVVTKKPAASVVAKAPSPITAGSRYAAIVVDAKTGATLHQAQPDSLRHPASLTKIMTLYLLFERLEAGRIKLGTEMPVTAEAAAQAPTKLGLKPGQTLAVEDAIKALVTKSANDAAVVVAEALGGSEDEFARQMTRKARALGMSRTIYRNASGLPDMEQVTTAREQALLGMAIQERFPRYYRYFSTSSFSYRGHAMRNHNKLLGRVAGVDGIKTGYTNASGFNLVTSMRRGDRHVVAVVMGGATGAARDARMRVLLDGHIAEASTRRTTTQFAEAPEPAAPVAAPRPVAAVAAPTPAPKAPIAAPAHAQIASADATATLPALKPGSTDPIKPVVVKTVMVRLASAKTTEAKVAPRPAEAKSASKPAEAKPAPAQTAVAAPHVASDATETSAPAAPTPPPGARSGLLGVLPATVAAVGNAVVPSAAAAERPTAVRSGWAIQIGAYEAESEARQKLNSAKSKGGRLLSKADPYTERTVKGDKTYYRARFAGFDHDQAEAICRQLKRSEITCMVLKI
jgi:D-alanyl-D-alanine carboxypeptidase